MPAPDNLSFETVGDSPGLAASWTSTFVSSFEAIADYGTTPAPWETFEAGWDNDSFLFSFTPGDISEASYGTVIVDLVKAVENFEELWSGNESYVTSLDSPEPEAAKFGTGLDAFEAFESEWDSNENWTNAFVGIGTDLSAADYDSGTGGQQDETFTTWAPGYVTSFVGVGTDLSAARYDGASGPLYETFAAEQAPREFSVDISSDVLTLAGTNPFADNDAAFVSAEATFPTPLQSSLKYFVRDTSGVTNKLALSPGGTAIDITAVPAGRVFLTGDPSLFWTEKMVTTAF